MEINHITFTVIVTRDREYNGEYRESAERGGKEQLNSNEKEI